MHDHHSDICSFDISKSECWPDAEQVQLDQSQLDAIKMALTQKVSVIQGPPGTGKTYIGIKIVQALLTNRLVWDSAKNSPLLVVCYTNHALDQFLEEIIDLHSFSVVRIGGRCQNEKVAEFSIKNHKIRQSRSVYREACFKREEVRDAGVNLDYKFSVTQENREPNFKDLIEFIAPIHKAQLFACVQNTNTERNNDVHFIGRDRSWRCAIANDFDDREDEEDYYDNYIKSYIYANIVEKGFITWSEGIGCKDSKLASNELLLANDIADNVASKGIELTTEGDKLLARGSKPSDDESTQTDMLKNNVTSELGDEDNDGTVNVLGEAQIIGSMRMVDQPAEFFRHADPQMNKLNIDADAATTKSVRFTHDTVNRIDDIFKLSKQDRLQLYNYWKQLYIEKLQNKLRADFEEYLTLCKEYQEATKEEDLQVLGKVDLIGMTTTGAAKYQHIIQKLKPKIIIVEEAAEVLESHIVSCLTAATQQLILIGDHKQLRPNPNEYYLARDCNLDISLFERLIKAGIPHATLEIQHRMRPEIAGLVCPHIYPKLLNHESVLQYENIQGVTTNMYFFHHEYPEEENDELRSHSNAEEAKLVVKLCRYFLNQGYSTSKITVLTTYTSQLLKLKRSMPRCDFEGVRITAVDNFQGEENDIILLSLVRSNMKGKVGFLSIANRICVALSRAKKGFYCFGNFTLLRESCETWRNILQYLEEQGKVGSCLTLCCFNHPDTKTEIQVINDFNKVPLGGCDRPCDVRLECGHVCKLYCHPLDSNHENYICEQPCTKKCDNGHPCKKLCSERCPRCTVLVQRTMPECLHKQSFPCYLKPEYFKCKAPCTKKCKQGHLCSKLCSQECGDCTTIVQKAHPKFGHIQDVYCYLDPVSCKCQYPCEKKCSTSPANPHKCEKLCYLPCGDCKVQV